MSEIFLSIRCSVRPKFQDSDVGCVLVYRYTKERNINELRDNSIYGYENNRNSPVYRYTRTVPRRVDVFRFYRTGIGGIIILLKLQAPRPQRQTGLINNS